MNELSLKEQDDWANSWWYRPWIRLVFGSITLVSIISYFAFESGIEAFFFIALSLLIIVPLEKLIPRHKMKFFRPELLTDFFHHFVSGFIGFIPLILIVPLIENYQSQTLSSLIQSQPTWLQILEALFLSEFLVYWGHRLSHQIPLLWRFHSVHHSVVHLDWLAGERRHPLDQFYMSLFIGIPMILSGFNLVDLLIIGVIQNLWDMTIHANLGWRLRLLDGIWVTSEFHHWHHSVNREARDKNYSGALPLFDRMFGTFYLPDNKKPGPYGIDTHMPDTYFGHLIQPFLTVDQRASDLTKS